MKVGEALKKAVEEGNAAAAGRISDFLRVMGQDYEQQFRLAEKLTGVSRARWDELMRRADEEPVT